ncbi:MAG: DUF2207 domain-containing protein [Clostridiales bacterium]|nr:DUF2207 domain-containing protein [Clostridiales bacterium]
MKKTKNIFAVLAALALILLTLVCSTFVSSLGTPEAAYAASSSLDTNFEFNRIDVEIEVGKNKVYTVKETLVTYFKDSGINRGIVRDIQRQTTTTRYIDGKKVKGKSFYAQLKNVKASYDGTTIKPQIETSSEMYSIYMRKPSGKIEEGEHTFVLEYAYDMSDDKVSGYDDFIFDVLGYEMNKTEVLTAKITFPANISSDKVSIRTNKSGRSEVFEWSPDLENEYEPESLQIGSNYIQFTAYPKAENKGYTVQVILPDGYFSEASLTFYWYYIIAIICAVGGIALALILFLRNFLQGKTLEVVEFYPPEGMSVMEFSSIWHRGARAKDSAALILKWANLGLLTIEKDGEKDLILRPTGIYDFSTFRLKSAKAEVSTELSQNQGAKPAEGEKSEQATAIYSDADKKYFDSIVEKKFYFRLFLGIGGDGFFSTRTFKSKSNSSKSAFFDNIKELTDEGKDKEHVKGNTEKVRTALPFIGLIPTLGVLIFYGLLLGEIFPVFFIIFMAAGTYTGVMWRQNPTALLYMLFPVVFYGGVFALFSVFFALTAYDYIGLLWISPIIWVICVFVLPFFVKGVRTEEAQKTYGRLKGFETFLLKAELPKIQLLFDENPEYFSDILAWCVIMGISDKVEKRFAALSFNLPEYMSEGIKVRWICRCMYHSHFHSLPARHTSSSGGGSRHFSGGGGGHHGSHGGGGGGGRSRGC